MPANNIWLSYSLCSAHEINRRNNISSLSAWKRASVMLVFVIGWSHWTQRFILCSFLEHHLGSDSIDVRTGRRSKIESVIAHLVSKRSSHSYTHAHTQSTFAIDTNTTTFTKDFLINPNSSLLIQLITMPNWFAKFEKLFKNI